MEKSNSLGSVGLTQVFFWTFLTGELPMEELLQKYAGAYASDFEVEASDTSSEALEPSTSEYEEESEEENSTSHSGIEGRGSGPCNMRL